jgi:hypothetical protein
MEIVRVSTELRDEQRQIVQFAAVPDLDMAGARGSALAALQMLRVAAAQQDYLSHFVVGEASEQHPAVFLVNAASRASKELSECSQRIKRATVASRLMHSPDLSRSAPESPAYQMVDKQQDNGPYQ